MSGERRCICGHEDKTHVFDGADSICSREDCRCDKFHLWEVVFYDPLGKRHAVADVAKFVRERTDLFDEAEREIHGPKSSLGKRSARSWTQAEEGLSSLTTGRCDSWHGWTLCTFPKTYVEPKPKI